MESGNTAINRVTVTTIHSGYYNDSSALRGTAPASHAHVRYLATVIK